MFSEWLFSEMEKLGVIKNYDKNPHTGKGRKPAGNLSVNPVRIFELKKSDNYNDKVWGTIAYIALVSNGITGKKTSNEITELAKTEPKLATVIPDSGKKLHEEFVKNFKKYS